MSINVRDWIIIAKSSVNRSFITNRSCFGFGIEEESVLWKGLVKAAIPSSPDGIEWDWLTEEAAIDIDCTFISRGACSRIPSFCKKRRASENVNRSYGGTALALSLASFCQNSKIKKSYLPSRFCFRLPLWMPDRENRCLITKQRKFF